VRIKSEIYQRPPEETSEDKIRNLSKTGGFSPEETTLFSFLFRMKNFDFSNL